MGGDVTGLLVILKVMRYLKCSASSSNTAGSSIFLQDPEISPERKKALDGSHSVPSLVISLHAYCLSLSPKQMHGPPYRPVTICHPAHNRFLFFWQSKGGKRNGSSSYFLSSVTRSPASVGKLLTLGFRLIHKLWMTLYLLHEILVKIK